MNDYKSILTESTANDDIISIAWRFYKQNFKSFVFYSLIPVTIFTIFQLIMSSISVNLQDNKDKYASILVVFMYYPAMILYFIISIFFNFGLTQAVFKTFQDTKPSYSEVFQNIISRLNILLATFSVLILEIISLFIIDTVVFISCIAVVTAIFIIISSFLQLNQAITSGIMIIFILIITLITLIIISFQIFFLLTQMIITTIENQNPLKVMITTFNLITSRAKSFITFITSLTIIWYIILTGLKLPVTLLMYTQIDFTTHTIENSFQSAVLMTVIVLENLIDLAVWPLVIISLTFFFLRWKMEKEGYDLKLTIK